MLPPTLGTRDRLLLALFAVQLATALVLGVVLVQSIDRAGTRTSTVATADEPGADLEPGEATGSLGDGTDAGSAANQGSTSGGAASAAPTRTSSDKDGGPTLAKGAPIKVGVLVTQTGAINFKSSALGTKAYFDMINEAGGVNGRRIEMLLRDDQLDATRGHAAVKEMINAGVFAFVAWNAPLTEQSIVPTLEQNKIPLVGNYGAIGEYRTPYAYTFTALYLHFGYQMARFAADLNVKKPGVIFISNNDAETDDLIRRGFREGFASKGLTIANGDMIAVDVTKASYDDTVAQLRLSGIDGIATLLDNTAYIRLQQSLNRSAYHPIHLGSPLLANSEVLHDPGVGSSINGSYVVTDLDFLDTGGPEVQQYVTEVRKRFGSQAQVNWAGEAGWLGANFFVQALRSAGTNPTRAGIMNALDTMTQVATGFTPPLTIRPGPHDINKCLKLGKVVSAKVVQVQDYACSPLSYP